MSDDFHKFMFLGAMIALAVFSNRGSLYSQRATALDVKSSGQKPVPLFVLDSPSGKTAAEIPFNKKPATQTVPSSSPAVSPAVLGGQLAAVSEDTLLSFSPEEKSSPALESPDALSFGFRKIGNEDPPKIGANVILVADLKSGDEFFSEGREKRWPIASITKLMTAAVVSKELAFNQSTTLLETDFPTQSSDTILKVGDKYSVADLMSAMLLRSSNESAEALARVYGRENFISAMKQEGTLLGVPDMHFSDPTGLSPTNQSTGTDLRKIALSIYEQYPDIFKTTRKASAYITELNSGKRLSIKNTNLLAARPDFLGGKTGYTDEAGGNLLSIFSYNRRPIVIIVLGSEDRFGDTEKLLSWFEKNYR